MSTLFGLPEVDLRRGHVHVSFCRGHSGTFAAVVWRLHVWSLIVAATQVSNRREVQTKSTQRSEVYCSYGGPPRDRFQNVALGTQPLETVVSAMRSTEQCLREFVRRRRISWPISCEACRRPARNVDAFNAHRRCLVVPLVGTGRNVTSSGDVSPPL